MRHGKKINHLGRTASHRRAMLANMASSLIKHKRIVTTVAKAKSLRVYVEPLITKSKNPSTHNYRTVFSYLGDKVAVNELFSVVSEKVANRPGGYTRILKTGNRMGDNAEMAMIELVDFNEFFDGFKQDRKKSTTRRSRRGTSTTVAAAPKAVAPKEEIQDAVIVEDVVETTPEVTPEVTNEAPATDAPTDEATEETTKD
jgi:large subunit ribosomal protein L17